MLPARTAKIRLASKYATRIRKNLAESIDAHKVAEDFFNANTGSTTTTPNEARTWAKINIQSNLEPLRSTLRKLYGDGWVLGELSAMQQYGFKYGMRKAAPSRDQISSAMQINWNTWTPGNKGAAALVKPKGGLQDLLDRRNVVIKSIQQTNYDRLGTKLADALKEGMSVGEAASYISDVLEDPSRAEMIANTEMADAMVQANYDVYSELGVEYLEYLVSDPCDDCMSNELASPLPFDEEWPEGDPPVHPNCECDVAPYVVDEEHPVLEEAVMADITKMGIPGPVEVERAKSRLAILPNPPLNGSEYVESPWKVVEIPTIDPNIWDNATVEIVAFDELVGTDVVLERDKVKERIKNMGQAATEYRSFAMIYVLGDQKIIIDGHHRLFAMWLLGMEEAPVWLVKEK